jgi:limonene-1,2-epoxide hydrolase
MEIDHDTFVRQFVEAFNEKDSAALAPFLHPDVVFLAYGDDDVLGLDAVLALWDGVFGNFETIRFETLHQAVNGDVVIAEQIHGLGLPGKSPAPVMNMAIYEMRDGKIAAWRDYSNPIKAGEVLAA